MIMLSLMASTHSSSSPLGPVLHQELPLSSWPLKDFPHHLPITVPRRELIRSSVLSLTPNEQDDLLISMRGLYESGQFTKSASIRRMLLNGEAQDKQAKCVLSLDVDEQWTNPKKLLLFLMSTLDELEKDYLDPSMYQDLQRIRALKSDMHFLHLRGTDFESSNISGLNNPILHPSGSDYDLVNGQWSPMVSDGQLPLIGGLSDVKYLVSVLEEFKLRKESGWKKQVLVPTFRWTDTVDFQDQSYLPSLTVDYLTTEPLNSPEKVKRKQTSKRKSKRRVEDRESYKNNSFQACETLLSLIMDKNRNIKSVTNSLKKAGPALPLLLTQFSASITRTGLAVMFSVIYKLACGSAPFGTSNFLVSVFGVGLFWLSWAVNKLRDTITYIGKKSTRLDFEEEQMMMRRVDKSVNEILFRSATLMAVFILRFA